MAKIAGSIWIHGNTLHFIDQNGGEWQWNGVYVRDQAAKPGCLWIEGPYIRYINEYGNQIYQVEGPNFGAVAGAKDGSLWIDSAITRLMWISNGSERRYAHHDVAHVDGGGAATHTNSHTDTPHANVPEGTHSNIPHTNTHGDLPHADSHTDAHSNTPHDDYHGDSHGDYHGDHGYSIPLGGHFDCYFYNNGQQTGHQDHNDSAPGSVAHCDNHDNVAHNDEHTDTHSDSHANIPHQNSPAQAFTDSIPHSNVPAGPHVDTPHGDVPHQDHNDATHANVPHVDNPTYLGP